MPLLTRATPRADLIRSSSTLRHQKLAERLLSRAAGLVGFFDSIETMGNRSLRTCDGMIHSLLPALMAGGID